MSRLVSSRAMHLLLLPPGAEACSELAVLSEARGAGKVAATGIPSSFVRL